MTQGTGLVLACLRRRRSFFVKDIVSVKRSLSHMNADTDSYYDVVIAGGGMVGTAMACALGSQPAFQGKTILLLEASPSPTRTSRLNYFPNTPFDNRVYAISPGSRKLFEEIGCWAGIESRRVKAFSKMHVFDYCSTGAISFDAAMAGMDCLAYIIENSVIMEALSERVENFSESVCVKHSCKIKDLRLPASKDYATNALATLLLDSGESIETKLVIGADGFNSFVRERARIETMSHDYRQTAVVATLTLEQLRANNTAWQRFLPTGPIALLPLSDQHSSLVWSTTNDHAQTLMLLPEDRFVTAVNNAFDCYTEHQYLSGYLSRSMKDVMSMLLPGVVAGSRLQTPPTVLNADLASRAAFPLGLKHATQYVRHRVAVIGDAAHRIHPMAGQGVNLGFGDVASLSRALVQSVVLGEDIGHVEGLLPYESDRQRRNVPILAGITGLNYLFSTSSVPLVLARTFGLHLTNSMLPIKEQIISYAVK